MKDWLPLINLICGFSMGYGFARFRAFKKYFSIADDVVGAVKKAGIRVHDGDRIVVIKGKEKTIFQAGNEPNE